MVVTVRAIVILAAPIFAETFTLAPEVYGLVVLLNVAGLGYIAYLLVRAGVAAAAETTRQVNANTAAVNRLVRMWALWLVTERRDVPEHVRQEARVLLEESRAERGEASGGAG